MLRCRVRPTLSILILLPLLAACSRRGEDPARDQVDESAAGLVPSRDTVGCVRTDPPPPPPPDSQSWRQDVRRGAEFRCVLRSGEAPVRVAAVGNAESNVIDSVVVHHPGGSLQRLPIEVGGAPPAGFDVLRGTDLNQDGWMDLMVTLWAGATGNVGYDVWMYDAGTKRFVLSDELNGASNVTPVAGRPCVATQADFGHAGNLYGNGEYCWENGEWTLVRAESQDWDAARRVYVRTWRERRGGKMVDVRVDTVRDSTGVR